MFCCLEVFEFGQKEKPEPVQYSSVGLQRRKEQPCLFTFTCGPSVAACTACDPMSRCEVTQRHQGPVTSDPLPLMSLTHITRGECPARHRGALTCRTRLNNTIISGIGYGHMARLTINRRVSPRHWIITGLFVLILISPRTGHWSSGKSAPTIHPDHSAVAGGWENITNPPPPSNNPPLSDSQRQTLRAKNNPTWIRSVRISIRKIQEK